MIFLSVLDLQLRKPYDGMHSRRINQFTFAELVTMTGLYIVLETALHARYK